MAQQRGKTAVSSVIKVHHGLDGHKRAGPLLAGEQQARLAAQVGGEGHALPAVAQGIMHPVQPPDVRHQVKRLPQVARPHVRQRHLGQEGEAFDHLLAQRGSAVQQILLQPPVAVAAKQETAVWRQPEIMMQPA